MAGDLATAAPAPAERPAGGRPERSNDPPAAMAAESEEEVEVARFR